MNNLGFDPIWWGIVYVLAAEQSAVTPPFGLSLFVLKGVVGEASISTIVRGAIPYLLAIYTLIILLTLFPHIVTWLPNILIR